MRAGAWAFGELIFSALDGATAEAKALERGCVEALKTSAATRYINGLRLAKVQNTCMIVGAFGILETEVGRLSAYRCSKKPLHDLASTLEQEGQGCLARDLRIIIRAVNVLKHGRGPSHDSLLQLQDKPSYLAVKADAEEFFCEGDVSEVPALVDVDSKFAAAASRVLREVIEATDPWV